jgi:hypothetical protein
MSYEKRARDHARSIRADPTDRISKSKYRSIRRPPEHEPWIWLTRTMLESPHWGELTLASRRCLDRIILEHLNHGLTSNGNLIVTYDQFEKFGVRRESVNDAIMALEVAGFIKIQRGKYEAADRRKPNIYTLTWYPVDIRPPTNDFRKVSIERLRAHLSERRKHRGRHRARREKYE